MPDKPEAQKRETLLALLQEEQEKNGCISEQFIAQAAESMGITVNEVYGVATFYSFLSTSALARNVIRVCKSVPCYFSNSQSVVDALQEELGILPGETTPDGKFSLLLTNCIGACDQAPAMLLNNELHGNLTRDKIAKLLKACL